MRTADDEDNATFFNTTVFIKSNKLIGHVFLSHEVVEISNQIILSNLYILYRMKMFKISNQIILSKIDFYRMKLLKISNQNNFIEHIFLSHMK